MLRAVLGLSWEDFKIECCHRIDGKFNVNNTCHVICCSNWYHDVQCILKNRKSLPKDIYVTEDLPEEWVDRRRVLKLIFNAARHTENLKEKLFLTKDKLVIDGKTYTANTAIEANSVIDVPGTCQRSDSEKTIFFGIHLIFSNMHTARFSVENVTYNCVEQMLQSQKAAYFNDDISHAKIMRESNPYKMKKLGSRICGFDLVKWRKVAKQVVYMAVKAKFGQNPMLKGVLINSGSATIAESSPDDYWGTGIHLHAKNAMDKRFWANQGGVMSKIYHKIRAELH